MSIAIAAALPIGLPMISLIEVSVLDVTSENSSSREGGPKGETSDWDPESVGKCVRYSMAGVTG